MNRVLVSAVCLTFVGCAGSGIEAPALPSQFSQATDVTPEETVANLREVEISSFADETVCRRESPTGSRIAVKRCYSRDRIEDAGDKVADYVTRNEIERMRQQQTYLEQARQREQAFQRALSQR